MKTVALDVHKRFAEIAVHESGALRRLGRTETSELRAFAELTIMWCWSRRGARPVGRGGFLAGDVGAG
jgi:hypothetical protein